MGDDDVFGGVEAVVVARLVCKVGRGDLGSTSAAAAGGPLSSLEL